MRPIVSAVEHWMRASHPKAGARRLLALLLAGLAAWAVFGGSQGLFALAMSQRDKVRLRGEIQRLETENKALELKLADVAAHPEVHERTAREQLLLMRPGEVIYRFN